MSTLRIALVGTGMVAGNHIEAVRAEPDRAELVAVCNIRKGTLDAFCVRWNITAAKYTDVTAMLDAESPDLVIIATPPWTHLDLCVQCMEAGASVLCEKPLVGSLAELDVLEAAQQRTGQQVSSIFHWRFGSGGQHMKALIDRDALGAPLVAICQTVWYRDATYYAVPWRGKWHTEMGGATVTLGIHAIDFLIWLMGGWEEVTALTASLDRDVEVDTVSMAVARFRNGAMGTFITSALSPRQTTSIRLDFQQATAELEFLYHYTNQDWRFSLIDNAAFNPELDSWLAMPHSKRAHQVAQLTALLDAIENDAPQPVSLADVRPTLAFVSAIYRSARTGQTVRRGEITPGDDFYVSMHGIRPED
ncbi:MAG: Gfo/Idh/MocA family oxidoreductase [Chloroflexota bacterium]